MAIYFIRHGQTDYNKKNLWMGRANFPLNTTGLQQVHNSAKVLSKIDFAQIYSSPLLRAIQTAQCINEMQRSIKKIKMLDELSERDFGLFEGAIKTQENRTKIETSPSVEAINEITERVAVAMEVISKSAGDVLIVSHSNVYITLVNHLGYKSSPEVKYLENAQCVRLIK